MNIPLTAGLFSTEEDFIDVIDRLRLDADGGRLLISYLREQHPVYVNKSTNAVIRMRGYALYAFSWTDLPEEAIPYVLDELENGRDAYLIGAAAVALRHAKIKDQFMAVCLLSALRNVINHDSLFSYDHYHQNYPLTNPTSAIKELCRSFCWLGGHAVEVAPKLESILADGVYLFKQENREALASAIEVIKHEVLRAYSCCDRPRFNTTIGQDVKKGWHQLKKISFETHDGQRQTYASLFTGKISLIAFFYSRCDNPLKCSLTIANLAAIQKRLKHTGVSSIQLAAITYDPVFDQANVLKLYAEKRGLELGAQAVALRTLDSFQTLQEGLDLCVNYVGNVVNRHAIELYLLDHNARVTKVFSREKMDVEAIVAEVIIVADQATKKTPWYGLSAAFKTGMTTITPLFIFLLPKCPLCFAAYLSLLGLAGSSFMPLFKYLLPGLFLITAINLFMLYRMGRIRHNFWPVYLCGAGSACIIATELLHWRGLLIPGLMCLGLGALINSLPLKILHRIAFRASNIWGIFFPI